MVKETTSKYKILKTKVVDKEKTIVLVEWPRVGRQEYSTHCIFPKGCEGLHHGNYYDDLKSAQKGFNERT